MRRFPQVGLVRESLRDNQFRPVPDWGSSGATGSVAIISDPFSIRRTRVAMLAADIRRVIGGRQASNVAHRIRVTSVWDSRHVTEPSERVGPRPSAIGYVANGGIAAF